MVCLCRTGCSVLEINFVSGVWFRGYPVCEVGGPLLRGGFSHLRLRVLHEKLTLYWMITVAVSVKSHFQYLEVLLVRPNI